MTCQVIRSRISLIYVIKGAVMPGKKYDHDEAVIAEPDIREKLEEPKRFKVLLHNDDFTTMDFVIFILISVFHHSDEDAFKLMMQVHLQGIALAGVYTYEVAETKVNKVTRLARERGFPFLSTMEEE
jgi:ATP-dependent Clp protease adaptor protein ClpS